MDLTILGRILLVVGALLVLAGLVALGLGKLGLGRLPGDLVFQRDGTTIYIPIVTMIVLSIILSLLLNLILWIFRGR